MWVQVLNFKKNFLFFSNPLKCKRQFKTKIGRHKHSFSCNWNPDKVNVMRFRRVQNQSSNGLQLGFSTSTPSSISRILGKRKSSSTLENRPKAAWPSSRMPPFGVKQETAISTQKRNKKYCKDASKCMNDYAKSDVKNNETSEDGDNQGMRFYIYKFSRKIMTINLEIKTTSRL